MTTSSVTSINTYLCHQNQICKLKYQFKQYFIFSITKAAPENNYYIVIMIHLNLQQVLTLPNYSFQFRLWVIYLLCPVKEIKCSNYYNMLAAYKIWKSASFHHVVLIYCFGTQCYNELFCFTYLKKVAHVKELSSIYIF